MTSHKTTRLGEETKKGTIGILAARSHKALKGKLNHLNDLAASFMSIKVMAFSLQGVKKQDMLISGYVYSPSERKWTWSTSPMPRAVINRMTLKHQWQNYFKRTLGSNMINNMTFNKWEMYEWLSDSPYFATFLPLTWLMRGPTDIIHFVTLYKQCYIKPVNGSYGKGIFKVSRDEKGYKIENMNTHNMKKATSYINEQGLIAYVTQHCKNKTFILQHVIDLYVADRPVDFRLILVKDASSQWRDVGLLARKGKRHEIVSHTGIVKNGYSALRNIMTLTRHEAMKLNQQMSEVGLAVAKEMETFGGPECNLGNLGIDFGIDKDQRLFVIEINHRNPRHRMALDAGEWAIYKEANALLADYATRIAVDD
ncbi:YheC/YheD family protein [Salipaludibacillus agaradhaerens]|uniref:YheC/YheD family protein n=1 Tax=Salipaludibacillus agaradhaerens TaxID=76935 RepID=UPI0009980129|nr:YheC/YheD family protein [Salipaludibacillus agaradhaerens]